MPDQLTAALAAWRRGVPIIVTVAEGHGSRGDLMLAAEHADPDTLNEILLHARGVLSLAIDEEIYTRLGLPRESGGRLSPNPDAPRAVATIEASAGVTTGISAADRARTIAAAIDPAAGPDAVRRPGHVPVLLAAAGGVRERARPVEAAVDVSRLAGMTAAGVLSEVLDAGGELADGAELERLSRAIGAPLLPVATLAAHLEAVA